MRPAVKIILLLGAVVVTVGVSLWIFHSPRSHPVGRVEAPPATNLAAGRLPAAPLAKFAPAPAPVALAAIPEWLKPVLAPVSGASYADRVKALQARTGKLRGYDIKAIYSYLLAPAYTDADSRSGENWLRNVMLDELIKQPSLPADLPGVLVSIYQDQQQDVVMRDYAVQHMDPAYGRASADEKTVLLQSLWDATAESDSSIAGTALLALSNLAQSNAEFDQNQIGQTALKLASDEQCGELARITALQLCAQMEVSQAASLALQLAQGGGSISLRISAIAALGNLGDRSTETFLQDIAAGSEDRLKPAAQTALKRLLQRLRT